MSFRKRGLIFDLSERIDMIEINKETDRFILRKIRMDDAADMLEMESDPEVLKFIGTPVLTSLDEIMKGIEYIQNQYRDFGMGRLAIEDKNSGEMLGWTGIKLEKHIRDFDYHDLGYRLKRKHWGKGIATETGFASLDIGFNEYGLDKVNAGARIDHQASRNVLLKLGFQIMEKFEFEGDNNHYFEISREAYDKLKSEKGH